MHTYMVEINAFFNSKPFRICIVAEPPKCMLISALTCDVTRHILCMHTHLSGNMHKNYTLTHATHTASFVSLHAKAAAHLIWERFASIVSVTIEGTSKI